jgi:NhaP-type Na+/H+ or K+/H+ antiporter
MTSYEFAQVIVGLAILGAVVLPRLLSDKPMSFPIIYVAAGAALFALPLGVAAPDPVENSEMTELLTELVVIIALMGAGLKLDRPFDWWAWSSTWRLLGFAMPITVGLTAVLGYWWFGMLPATAVLLGAVVAPTDPVLASDVQATPPTVETVEEMDPTDQEGAIRFALTSEAGLNDGLAFPFTNLAIAMAAAAGTTSLAWLGEWVLVDVVYKIVGGVIFGYLGGRLLAGFIFGAPATTDLAQVMEGAEALATTLIVYGVTELAGAYGFIAVFVAALELRHYEWEHEYYNQLHDFAVIVERLLMAAVLVLFGGAVVGGLLAPLTWLDALVGLVLVLIVRPVAGILGLVGTSMTWGERLVVSAFGIRGIGSFFYLAHALNEASFGELELLIAADRLWAVVGFVVLASVVLHGMTASPVMKALDRRREHRESAPAHTDMSAE